MHNFKAIIFDMDGLLVDSEIVWAEAESLLLAKRGLRYDEHHSRSDFIGYRLDEFFERLSAAFGFPGDPRALSEELTAYMLALVPLPGKVVGNPGADTLLDFARRQGIPCAIASSSPQSVIEAIVEACGWGDVLTTRVSADLVARGKPAPDVYLETARRLGHDPADCLALEDSPNGARAAVAAGMTCYAVPDRSHSTPSLFDSITPFVFDSLHGVLARLDGRTP